MTKVYTYEDIKRLAKRRMPKLMFDYVEGGAGRELLIDRNEAAFDDIYLQPRSMVHVVERSLKTTLLGREWDLPFGIAPMGMCNLAWPGTDRMFAEVAKRHNIPLGTSVAASTTLEDMFDYAGNNVWFQVYVAQTDELTFDIINRAKSKGYDTLLFTVDVPELSPRTRDIKNGFQAQFKIGPRQFLDFALHPRWSIATLLAGSPRTANFPADDGQASFVRTASRARVDWDYMARVRELWPGNLVVKGVLSPEDARGLRDAGIDAVYVSNHGGRQLDSAPPAIRMLPKIREAVGPDFPLIFDSGIRNGESVVKALALGADFVMVGRPFNFASGAGGEPMIDYVVQSLRDSIDLSLAQLAHNSVTQVGPDSLVRD